MQMEKEAYHSIGFVDGIDTASAILHIDIQEALADGRIIISKGQDELFRIVDSLVKSLESKG